MDEFQRKTAALFLRRWIENAIDRGDQAEATEMSRQLDRLTLERLRAQPPAALTATGGRG